MLYVPCPVVHLFKFGAFGCLFLLRRMQPVLLFQFPGDLFAADMLELVVYLFARIIYPDGNDMDMMPCYIFVLVHHIRLIAVPQLIHILFGNIRQLAIGKYIVRVRVQGDMDNRFFRFQVCGQVHIETFHTTPDAEIPVLALKHTVT